MNIQTNTETTIIEPPGELIYHTENINDIENSGSFYFDNSFTQPLSPLVEAEFKENQIEVRALIFVNSIYTLQSLKVKQLFSISDSGKCKLQFFIYCSKEQMDILKSGDESDDKLSPKPYLTYIVKFTAEKTKEFPNNISLENINIVQAFTWDIDPETSRGTETTVKGSNGE